MKQKAMISAKEYSKNFLENVTTHGVARIVNSQNITRLIWLILTLLGIVGAITYIIVDFVKFLEYEVTQSITIIQEGSAIFPAVTFCHMTPFDFDDNHVFLLGQISPAYDSLAINVTDTNFAIDEVEKLMNYLRAQIYVNSVVHSWNRSFIEPLGFTLEDMLVSCYFDGEKCDANDFTWYHDYHHGNCYTFNKKVTPTTTLYTVGNYGPKFGLTMELFAGVPDSGELSITKGFKVIVNNNTEDVLTSYYGSFISVGQLTNIGIRKKQLNRLTEPYSNCTEQITENTETLMTDKEVLGVAVVGGYLYQKCAEICEQKYFNLIQCDCQNPAITLLNTTNKICQTQIQLKCLNDFRLRRSSSAIYRTCRGICPESCSTTSYITSQNTALYPSDYYYKELRKSHLIRAKFQAKSIARDNITKVDLYSSVAALNVYLEELSYDQTNESPTITPSSLLGTLGGLLGLFVGMSLLSLFEWLEFSIKLIALFFKKCTSRGKKVQAKK